MISKSTEQQTAESAYQYALRLLTARDYSVVRMRAKLCTRGVEEADVETVMHRLQQEGWLDERRYAERFAESALSAGRFYGPRLRLEMRRRGFEAGIISEVLESLLDDHDQAEDIMMVVNRRYPGLDFESASDREKRRVVGYLQRRGFGLSEIFRSLKTAR
ncbi:MAG: regulatory protein RecX [Geobacteraceae bacterium]|nr:regulatory protein RecX [Geobacteraceae bacterium]